VDNRRFTHRDVGHRLYGAERGQDDGGSMTERRRDEPPTPCPPWCGRRHTQDDHFEDQLHQSPPRYAVLVTRRSLLAPDDVSEQDSPVVARLVQHPGSPLVWLEVAGEEDARIRLAVTVESARRLVAVLEALLAQLPA
jgi:hypothetical protein